MHSDLEIFEHKKLPWPLVAIDFEASALGFRSFPIEVGIARWQSFEAEIEVWGALIKPTDGWVAGGIWSAEAEAVHSIRKTDLTKGLEPGEIMDRLHRVVPTGICWCDGAAQDDFWLGTLAHAAGVAPRFKLGDWDALGGALQPGAYERMVRWLDCAPPRHRAPDDAERLLRAVAIGLKATYEDSRLIELDED